MFLNIFLLNIIIWLKTDTFATALPQAADNTCPKIENAACYCNSTYIECEASDDAALLFYNEMMNSTIVKCLNKINGLAFLQHWTSFSLSNCWKLPTFPNKWGFTYKAIVLYSNQTLGSSMKHSVGIQRLRLIHSTYDLKLPAKLFQDSKNMTHLSMMISGTDINGAFYEQLFEHLVNLEMVVLHAFYATKNLTFHAADAVRPLKYLDLSYNFMKMLPADMFGTMSELNYLNLAGNELMTLPINVFEKQQKLLILDLSMNNLEQLPVDLFRDTPLLWQLRLQGNAFMTLTSIIENINPLRYLHRLDLTNNKLETLQDNKGGIAMKTLCNSFQERISSGMLLQLQANLSFIFANLPKAVYNKQLSYVEINLSRNRITHFDMAWLQQSQLAGNFTLDLSNNNIKHINITTATLNANKNYMPPVDLANNPLECDCVLTWLVNNNYLYIPNDLQCSVTQFEKLIIQVQESCTWLPALCPTECVCRLDVEALNINCDGAALMELSYLPRPEPFTRQFSQLSLSHNRFRQLPSNNTIGYANVTHLNVSHNVLTLLSPAQLPAKLLVLDVRHNHLEHLSAEFISTYLNENATLQQLYLADNPWKCDCSAKLLLHAIRAPNTRIADVGELVCENLPNVLISDITFVDICEASHISNILINCLAVLLILLLFIVALYYKFRKRVNVWLYYHKACLCCINEDELDKDKHFDAFISYAHQDEDFINQTLLPQLEQGTPPFRICTHERNWLAGAYIPEQIVESVAQSCRTIIILSQHFIESDWARMEFCTAHQYSLNEGRARIIIVKYGEISCTEQLDEELKAYLDANTYLDWADPGFWQKLRYALPHRKGESRNAGMLELPKRVYVIGAVEMNR